ncbi:MAG TPA: hypothetical protein EYP09_03085, partial [Anaerolineae bacterium]|nr:hypothetical protein [Anaerolineae bacterium]
DEFSRFVAELAEGLHREGKLLTLAVEPPTLAGGRWETGAYDWRALGEAVDGLKVPLDLLTYDLVERAEALLDWAVGEVNRYKLQLVISARSLEAVGEAVVEVPYVEALAPLARIALEGAEQTLVPGQEVTLSLATLRESGGLKFDEGAQTYWFSYTDDEGRRHIVWLEDAGSMAHKLRLAARYNLRGVAVRGLGDEGNDRRIWAVLRQFAQLAVPEVESQFAVVWTVQGAEGELEEETKPLSDARYVWKAPPKPGQYTVAAAISADGGRTVSSRAGVALRVAAPTPTPTPTPRPTPTPTATPAPTPTPTPKPTAAAPPPPPKPPAPRAPGFFGYGIQAHMIDQDHGPIINAIKGLGFNWVKQQIEWKRFEPAKGQYNWGEIDRLVDSCHAAGLNVLLSVVKAPKWARPANTDFSVEGPPANPQDFADFLAAMAARYCGRVQAIEVWNEQNINYEWGNEPPDPGRYVQLLAASYKAIKSVCPQMIVVSGALTPAGDVTIGGQWRAVDDINYLEAMYRHGLKHYCDAVGAHPSGYNVPPDADWRTWSDPTARFRGPSDNRHHSWVFRGTMEGYRNVMLKYGDGGKRIWPTEFGWASVEGLGVAPAPGYEYAADNTEAEQAQFIVKAYQMGKSWGWVGPMFLWNLNFGPICGPHDEKAAFSILYPDWGPRPAYAALRDMAK